MQRRLKVKRRFKEVYNNFVLVIHNSWLQRLWTQTYKTYKVTVIKFNQNPKSLHKATSYCCSNKELLLRVSLAESLQEVRVIHELLQTLIKLLVFPSPLQPLQCDFLYFDDLTVNYIKTKDILV